VKSNQQASSLATTDTPVKDHERAGAAEMPRLAALAGQIVEARKPGDILELRAFRPEDIGSDRLVERALRTSTD